MAIKKINTDLQIEAGLLDGDGNSGSNNQILISTGTGIDWVNASTVIGGPYLPLSAGTSYPLTGVLYIAGTIRNNSGDLEIRNQTASGYATATKLMQQTVNGLETFLTLDGTSRNAYFTNQGNVGIGTTNATHKLTVNAPNDTTAVGIDFPSAHFDFSANSTSGYTTSFHMDDTATTIGSNSAGRALIFQTNNTDRLYINGNTGNVGIGTAGPSATFVVQPSETSFNLAGLANGQIALGNNTSSGKAPTIGSRTTSTGQPPLQFITGQPNTSTVPGMIFSVREDNNSEFETTANKPAYDFTRYTTSLLRITRDGKVGIGNTSPSQKLEVTGGNVKADEYIYNATDRTSSKNWKYLAAVNAGTYRELGSWRATEGNVALRITVQSKTSANSGTAVYMFQGGFNQAEDGWYELVPAFKGGGHGNAQDGWKVLWYESTSYTFKIAVAVPTGLANKNLNVSIEYLGDTEGDSYYQYSALTTTGTIPTYSLERTTSYSNRNLVSSDSITAQYDATNYTILGYDYLDTYGGNQLFKVAGTERLRIDTSGNATFTGDILMPTAGQQLRIGSFTDGASNNGEYANDDLVIGDGSISIYPHRRGDYGLNESTATSTTFRSKLNIWSDNEDHITFGGASTHMVSAWETWKIWINNDSASNGIFKLYHTNAKTEFARFSGDGTTSFITGKFKATKELAVSSIAATNGSPATDNISVSGYGMIGNRGSVYLTNSSTDSAASIQIGVGGVHAASTKLLINPSNSIFSTNVRVGADSTYSLGTDVARWANVYADNFHGDGSNLTNVTAEWDGSHTGNASIDGDLTVTGTVTAQEFHTEFVSASIVYESGSTQFGDSADDTHTFTGTLTLAGPTGNATMTTTAAGDLTIDADDDIRLDAGGGDIVLRTSGTEYGRISAFSNALRLVSSIANEDILLMPNGTGNVGIGTTSPAVRLDFGSATGKAFHLYTSGTDYYGFNMLQYDSGPFSTNIFAGNGGDIKLRTASGTSTQSTRLTVKAAGNVGIGTTNPSAKLEVQAGGTTNVDVVHFSNSNSVAKAKISLSANSSGELSLIDGNNNTDVFITSNGDSYFNGGNVGIGVTSPVSKLHSKVTSSTTALMLENSTGGSGAYVDLDFNTYNTAQSGWANAAASIRVIDNGAFGGDITFRGKTSGIGNTQAERMRIEATGNVGIGTTAPDARLHVDSNTAFSLTDGSADTLLLTNDSTTSTIGAIGPSIGFGNMNSNRRTSAIAAVRTGGDHDNMGLAFFTHPSDSNDETVVQKMTIKHDGNVGIGTTSPSSKLEVYGSGSTVLDIQGSQGQLFSITDDLTGTLFAVSDISGVPIFAVEADGEVSIDGDLKIKSANITYQENIDVDSSAAETIATVNTGEYTGAFFDYTCVSGSNARVGTVMAISVGGSIEFTDNSTTDIGDTSGAVLSVDISGGSMRLRATTTTDDWIIKTLIRTL